MANPANTDDKLLTLDEVADYLRLQPDALYNQRLRNAPPGALGIKIGGRIRFRAGDIERYLDERSASASA